MNRKHTFVLRGLVLLLSLIAKIYSNVTPELENSALNKPTVQGPRTHRYIDHYYKSSFAVDGNPSPLFPYCAAVDTDNVMWWAVDLTRSRKIHSVIILTRSDSRFRLENFTVDGFDSDPRKEPGFPRNFGQICVSRVDQLDTAVWTELPCSAVMETRFVRIVKHGYDHLALCEMEILAEVIGNEVAYKFAPKSIAQTLSNQNVGQFDTAPSCGVALVQDKDSSVLWCVALVQDKDSSVLWCVALV